jgi:hypothetical protein
MTHGPIQFLDQAVAQQDRVSLGGGGLGALLARLGQHQAAHAAYRIINSTFGTRRFGPLPG